MSTITDSHVTCSASFGELQTICMAVFIVLFVYVVGVTTSPGVVVRCLM